MDLKHLFSLIGLISLGALTSCDPSSPEVIMDYFPLKNGTEWTYISETTDHGTKLPAEEFTLRIDGDTIMDGKTYKKFIAENGMLEKIVRKTGNQYYGRNHELYAGVTHEYMFLDTSLPVNEGWEYLKFDGIFKTKYKVIATNATEKIDGVEYTNVLKLEAVYYDNDGNGNYKERYTTLHYYAPGVGEIYSYYPVDKDFSTEIFLRHQ